MRGTAAAHTFCHADECSSRFTARCCPDFINRHLAEIHRDPCRQTVAQCRQRTSSTCSGVFYIGHLAENLAISRLSPRPCFSLIGMACANLAKSSTSRHSYINSLVFNVCVQTSHFKMASVFTAKFIRPLCHTRQNSFYHLKKLLQKFV